MRIMLDTYLGLYCQDQTQPSIILFEVLRMIGTQEEKSQQENSFRMILRSTITWRQKNNLLRQIPRMLNSFNNNSLEGADISGTPYQSEI